MFLLYRFFIRWIIHRSTGQIVHFSFSGWLFIIYFFFLRSINTIKTTWKSLYVMCLKRTSTQIIRVLRTRQLVENHGSARRIVRTRSWERTIWSVEIFTSTQFSDERVNDRPHVDVLTILRVTMTNWEYVFRIVCLQSTISKNRQCSRLIIAFNTRRLVTANRIRPRRPALVI